MNLLPCRRTRATKPAQLVSSEVRPLDEVSQGRSITRKTQLHETSSLVEFNDFPSNQIPMPESLMAPYPPVLIQSPGIQ